MILIRRTPTPDGKRANVKIGSTDRRESATQNKSSGVAVDTTRSCSWVKEAQAGPKIKMAHRNVLGSAGELSSRPKEHADTSMCVCLGGGGGSIERDQG